MFHAALFITCQTPDRSGRPSAVRGTSAPDVPIVPVVLVGLVVPVWARRFHDGWMRVASVLGYVNNRILITAVFFLAIVPLGLLARVLGRNRLGRRGVSDATYWVPRPTSRQTREGFERSF